jgi:hypothetical protein
MQARNANRPEEAIPRIDRQVLRKYYGDLVDHVSVFWGADPLNHWDAIGNYSVDLGGEEASAQTYGHRIYVRYPRENLSDHDRLEILAHELVHAQQYDRFGQSLSEFGYQYFREYKRANQDYRNNKLEQEAYDRAGSIINGLVVEYRNAIHPPTFCLVGVDGALTIRNPTTAKVAYSLRWSATGNWTTYTLNANRRRLHVTDSGCGQDQLTHQIRFDSSFAPGYQAKSYNLDYQNLTSGSASAASNPGTLFLFKKVGNGVDLYRQ